MREILVGVSKAAIARHDLKSYRDMLDSQKIGWDIDGSFGNFKSLPISVGLEDRSVRHISYLGYVPSVLLYRRWVGPQSPIEGEAFKVDFTKNPDALKDFAAHGGELPKKSRVPVRVDIFTEVWFGIAPMRRSWTWEPVFEKRHLFRIGGDDGTISVNFSSYDPILVSESVKPTDRSTDGRMWRFSWLSTFIRFPTWNRFFLSPHADDSDESFGSKDLRRERFEDRWLIELNSFDHKVEDPDLPVGEGQFYYERVDLASCMKYVGYLEDPHDRHFEGFCEAINLNRDLWPKDGGREAWYSDYSDDSWPIAHFAAPTGTFARAIEQNLLQADTDHRLDIVLLNAVAKRVADARAYYEAVVEKRDRKIATLLRSWERDVTSGGSDHDEGMPPILLK